MIKQIFHRRIACVVLISFCSLITQPLQAAMQMSGTKPFASRTNQTEYNAAGQTRLLGEIHGILRELEPQAAYGVSANGSKAGYEKAPVPRNSGPNILRKTPAKSVMDRTAGIEALKAKQAELTQFFIDADADFNAVRQHLIDKKLPAAILMRQTQAVAKYRKRRAEYRGLMQAVLDADARKTDLGEPLRHLTAFMARYPNKRSHTPSDPNKLPFSIHPDKVRAPIETKHGYKTSKMSPLNPGNRFGWAASSVAATGSLSGIGLPSMTVSPIPTADDLGETEDVQLTPDILAQAADLNNNPVQIHNWVRNNIEFIPSYGSIQGSELTFKSKRGNAFDTASLEIALLRAAKIPARYVYGTVQIPSDKVMNWVGGVTIPEAAQSLLGQGGIPNVAVVSGGKISSFKFEHVWVEAWVDYIPSRGAVNSAGDTWIPLDASFKQYKYTAGVDLQSAVPVDSQTILDQIKIGATVNDTEGWVQNLDSYAIHTALTDYQTRLQTYIDNQIPKATVGDVLGTKQIIAENPGILMGTLPYKTVATGTAFSVMPSNLRHQFRFNLYAGDLDRALDSPVLALTKDLTTLAGKKITLSFGPATQDDLDLINSYLPSPHPDGTPIDPSELPTSLPGYLIHLKAEIRIDGQIVEEGGDFTMGQELATAMGLNFPGRGWEYSEDNHPIAGEYDAIGLDLQGVSSDQMIDLKTKIEQTKAEIDQFQTNSTNTTPLDGLNKEDLSGDVLYAGILGYFASVDASDQLMAKANQDIVAYRLPSYGIFLAAAQPHYWFGIARSVSFPGVVMDVDKVSYHVEAKNAGYQKKIIYMRQVGTAGSALEHAVPESLFIDPSLPQDDPRQPKGVSAVRLIGIAASQGQKIYTLNAENKSLHATLLNEIQIDSDVRQEIINALAAGKEVTTHQSELTINGWSGSGYIILDPDTGAGAYKIGGGANGGFAAIGAFFASILTFWETWDIAAHGNLVTGFSGALGVIANIIDVMSFAADTFEKCASSLVASLLVSVYVSSIMWMVAILAPVVFTALGIVLFSILIGQAIDQLMIGIRHLVCR